ncbi:MAG: hypothetical protein ACFFDJ_09345 [Candidatus Odinarchaeota archaeon]
MSLSLRYTWLLIATIIITVCSIFVTFDKRHFSWAHTYNESFLSLFGIETGFAGWVRYLFSWILSTCIATVVLTLLVNLADSFLLLVGLSGIPTDIMIIPLIISGFIISLFLLIVAMIPVMTMPLACPSALTILTLVQLFSVPFYLHYLPSLVSTFLYFAAIATGFVGVFLSIYMLFRNYIGVAILKRFRGASSSSMNSKVEKPEG